MQKIKMLVYGRSFSGKTTLAKTFPKPYFINTDGNVRDAQLKLKNYTTEKTANGLMKINYGFTVLESEIKRICDEINEGKFEYETIVFDLITHVWDFMVFKLLKEAGKVPETSTLNDLKAYGAGTKQALSTFAKVIQPILDLAANEKVNVVFLAHLNVKTITKADKSQIDLEISTLNEKAEQWLLERMDISSQIELSKDGRILKVEWAPDKSTGNRFNLKDGIKADYDSIKSAILGGK